MTVKLLRHPHPRIIIFVEQRETAHLLADILNASPALADKCRSMHKSFQCYHASVCRATHLVGHGPGSGDGMDFREQQVKIKSFRENQFNVLVSTNGGFGSSQL